ncbi:hypothetical protein J9B83_11895 [Marinomonas sp. A79]|uniref:Uncharacterized protein n=1 Tax=Marinomonas vulgaris TaxID=2823372 RepID=A0ABS5HDC4_9GAMM|nr:hypothetical protein [Marinomonas vulgaris]MBR7889643.1 hypothetical protein [Marinomonas vulgaris]
MAIATMSLQRRLQQTVFALMLVSFVVLSLVVLYFLDSENAGTEEKNIALKHQVVEQAFNRYLSRAEGEMTFIGQDLSLNNYDLGRELDVLFSHHEVLFFGGLDFFYIEWVDGRRSMDPRARLFTTADFDAVLKVALFNRWVTVITKDNAHLLVLKTKLISAEQKNLGFLYGFISLDDNVTFASELLQSAPISAVRIYDKPSNHTLMEERKVGEDLTGNLLRSSLPLRSPVEGNLQLEILQPHPFSSNILINALPLIIVLGVILLCFYLLLLRLFRTLIFQPLENIVLNTDDGRVSYTEIESLQQQTSRQLRSMKTKEDRFMLLAESVNSAVIFCSEVAEIELINAEAQRLFPDASKARTLFDFMPISCHQAVQGALKGDVGVRFTFTLKQLGKIYQWQVYSFHNDSRFRSLLLIGQDITQEVSLQWQLEQLQPLSAATFKKADVDAVLDELAYLSVLPERIGGEAIKGWLSLILSILKNIRDDSADEAYLPIGDLLREESAGVMAVMGIEANRVFLDCSVATGRTVVPVNAHLKGLIRVLLMIVMTNNMVERRLAVRFEGTELELTATKDIGFRRLFLWIVDSLLDGLSGQKKILQNNALQINIGWKKSQISTVQPANLLSLDALLPSKEQWSADKQKTSGKSQLVAWVVNDYPHSAVVESALSRFGLQVDVYESSHRFFTRPNGFVQYDAILIGCDQDTEAQIETTQKLKFKYQRDQLPIVWLNSTYMASVDPDVFVLQGCFFDDNLHQVLQQALLLDGVTFMPSYEQEGLWVMVGGSRVTKAIWFTALEEEKRVTQWLADLSHYFMVLSHYPDAVVILLEPQANELLESVQAAFPKVRFFSLQRWPKMPDNVTFFHMNLPYTREQIIVFAHRVTQQDSDVRSNE